MSSHAAYRSDNDLLTRTADGDGAAALVLLSRHGATLQQQAAALTSDPDRAAAAVVATFATLLTGTQRPATGTGLAWLHAAVIAHATAASFASSSGSIIAGGGLVAALADALPTGPRAALLAAYQEATHPHDPHEATSEAGVTFRVAGDMGDTAPLAPANYPLVPPNLTALPQPSAGATPPTSRHGTAPRAEVAAGRSLDRYIDRPSPLRWVAPLALVAAFVALWSWSQFPVRDGRELPFPDPRVAAPTANWPTLPPRTTRVIALQDDPTPLPTAISTATIAAPPTRQPAMITAMPSVAPSATVVAPPVASGGSASLPTPTVAVPLPKPAATSAPPAPPTPTPVRPTPTRAAPPTATVPPQPSPTRPPPTRPCWCWRRKTWPSAWKPGRAR